MSQYKTTDVWSQKISVIGKWEQTDTFCFWDKTGSSFQNIETFWHIPMSKKTRRHIHVDPEKMRSEELSFAFLLVILGNGSSLLFTWANNYVFGQVSFSSACMCLSVCPSVCESVPRLSKKVLDRFWWNLVGWCIIIKDRFLLKMGWIDLVERISRPFEMLK